MIYVENSGDQLSEEVAQHVFEPFFTTKKIGTGLGLSIVHNIARSHGGTASLAVNETGRVRFVITLPARDALQTAEPLEQWLPDIDGYELCRQVRQRTRRANRILFFSGAASELDRQKGFEAGADAYIFKPNFAELIETLSTLIAGVRARDQGKHAWHRLLRVISVELPFLMHALNK